MASHNKNQDSLHDLTPTLSLFNILWIYQINNNKFLRLNI